MQSEKVGGFVPPRYETPLFDHFGLALRTVAERFDGTSYRGGATVCVFLARRQSAGLQSVGTSPSDPSDALKSLVK